MTEPATNSAFPAAIRVGRAARALRFALVLGIAAWTALGGCSSQPKVEDELETEVELDTGQEVQNVVSFPFRIVGGAVVYPLKFLFYDMPNGIADAFKDELHEAKEKLKSSEPGERLNGVTMLAESGSPKAVARTREVPAGSRAGRALRRRPIAVAPRPRDRCAWVSRKAN